MAFDLKVTGGAELRVVRNRLRAIGDKGLGKQMSKGIQRALKPFPPEVRAEAGNVMPERGGYRDVLLPSLRFRSRVKETRQTCDIVIRVYGDGKGEQRDVRRLNRGQLRHPNPPGRFRRRMWTTTKPRKRIPGGQLIRNDWSVTKIRAGFVDRPADRILPQAVREIQSVIDYVAEQIGA